MYGAVLVIVLACSVVSVESNADEFLMRNLLLMSCFVVQTLIICIQCTEIRPTTKWRQNHSLLCVNERFLYEFNVAHEIDCFILSILNEFLLRITFRIDEYYFLTK